MEHVAKGQALGTVFAPEWLGPLNEIVGLKRAGVSTEILDAAREALAPCPFRPSCCARPKRVRRRRRGTPCSLQQAAWWPSWAFAKAWPSPQDDAVSHRRPGEGPGGGRGARGAGSPPDAGQKVKAVLQADASQTFSGERKEFFAGQRHTRTLQARFEVDNEAGSSCPGCCCACRSPARRCRGWWWPAEAVIRTGTRAVAIVRKDDGSFEPREVKLVRTWATRCEIVQGLNEGDQVVASGQFLVDSEAAELGSGTWSPPGSCVGAAGARACAGQGRAFAAAASRSRMAIAELKWPA